jgi:hypothetical protein
LTPTAALVFLLQVSAPGPENWAYVTCMTSSASEVLKENPSPTVFQQRLERLCAHEEEVLRRLIVRRQLADGRSHAQAAADADGFFAEIRNQMLSLLPKSAR